MVLICVRTSRELPELLTTSMLTGRYREDLFAVKGKRERKKKDLWRAAATRSTLVPFVTLVISSRRASLVAGLMVSKA